MLKCIRQYEMVEDNSPRGFHQVEALYECTCGCKVEGNGFSDFQCNRCGKEYLSGGAEMAPREQWEIDQ
jgi:tRNA(Ile2) C34 agmatinyltransferase TiaS